MRLVCDHQFRTQRKTWSTPPFVAVFLGGLALALSGAIGQEATVVASEFDKQSLAVRTALHYDPSLDSPLKSLITLYRNADRTEELIGLYRGHITQYPEDAGAKAVLIRILRELNRGEADEFVQSAIQLHPDDSLLNFLHYESRVRRQDARALESLSRAIELESKASLRNAWAEILLKEAGDGPGRDLARAHLEKARLAEGNTADTLLILADRMHRHGFHDLAMVALLDAAKKNPGPEAGVEIDLLTARVQGALGDREAAGARLDALLARLATDHWRRLEIVSLRVGLLTSEADRTRLLEEAKKRYEANPAMESAALEYAELLAVSERRREALNVLRAASGTVPQSERVERQTLSLLDRLDDAKSAEAYLADRLERFPDRTDLRYRYARVLYSLGRGEDATPQLERVLKELPAEEADRRLVELARHLRKENLFSESAKLFQRIVDAQPDRFDVRRELAEAYLAVENRAAARTVLRDLPANDATIENFLDLIQFMVSSEFLVEAREALEARLATAPGNLDLSLPLSTVLAKAGDRGGASSIILEARASTDTAARYRAWLEAALEVHEVFGDLEHFYDAEQQRLMAESGDSADAWTAARAEKFLIYCELGEGKRLESRVTQALRNQLADAAMPVDLKLKLRRLLVKALERFPERAGEAEQQLQLLAKEDGARSQDYDLRRALLYHSLQRTDLAREALEKVNVNTVSDLPALKAAFPVYIEYGMPAAARRCLEEVTKSDPSDLITWEKRLSLLAAMGEEEELRRAIRQLLAGGERVNLGVKSVEGLRLHLLDSLWRSISKRLGAGSPEKFAEVLTLLETVDREAPAAGDRLWSLWARAHVLNRQGHHAARDAVIQELTALAGRDGKPIREISIEFPDGLSISLVSATELLRVATPSAVSAGASAPPQGPLAAPEMEWAFEIDPRARILQMELLGDETSDLLILDSLGAIYRVDRRTGKLLWSERFGEPEVSPLVAAPASVSSGAFHSIRQQGMSISVRQMMAPYQFASIGGGVAFADSRLNAAKLPRRFVVDGRGNFYLPASREIEARSAADGGLVWSADLRVPGEDLKETAAMGVARPELQIGLEGDTLLAFVPETSVAAGLDLATGKLIWMRQVGEPTQPDERASVFSLNSGMSVREGRLFVFGTETVILDAATGDAIWRFDGETVRTFPLSLMDTSATNSETEAGKVALAALTPRPGFLDHHTPTAERADVVRSFLQYQGALVAPATHWSAARLSLGSAATAVIGPDDRLLLFGDRGFRAISLKLPLASEYHRGEGVFLGMVGHQAWFLGARSLTQVDLRSGRSLETALDPGFGGDEPVRAFLSGGRLYAMGEAGVLIFNAHDASRIGGWSWPESAASYRQSHAVAARPGENAMAASGGSGVAESQYIWQGIVDAGEVAPAYCLPVRDRVSGDTLFALMGERAVIALRSEKKPAPQP